MTLTKNDFGIEPLTKISTNHIELYGKGWIAKNMEASTESERVGEKEKSTPNGITFRDYGNQGLSYSSPCYGLLRSVSQLKVIL